MNVSGWTFSMEDPAGVVFEVPGNPQGANSLEECLGLTMEYIDAYDNATNGEYSRNQRSLALDASMDFRSFMRKLIEHQMCLRGKAECYQDGLGDKLHNVMTKVDAVVASAPGPLKKVAESIIAAITPSHTTTLGGCSRCGGTRTFQKNKDNLGRAGRLNRFGR